MVKKVKATPKTVEAMRPSALRESTGMSDARPTPFKRSELDTMSPGMVELIETGARMGLAVIDENEGELNVWREPVCQRCKRSIPHDANYCPYCARPVAYKAPQASTEACPVHRGTIKILKRIFPAEVVDVALRDGTLKLVKKSTGKGNYTEIPPEGAHMSEAATRPPTPATLKMLDRARELFGKDLIDSMVEQGEYRIIDESEIDQMVSEKPKLKTAASSA
ncbi:MAG TPA: hypothetical protein PKM50_08115 [Methanoregula sp.]|nr:hypothetical protein [Methanoregula sp.]